ncbi:MAG: site-specific integrase [Deltaproteobacteria bacterium]|nr:site-specific integrase [Deltaproteobacteria bacterium]
MNDLAGFSLYLVQERGLRRSTYRMMIWRIEYLIRRYGVLSKEKFDKFLIDSRLENKSEAYLNGFVQAIIHYARWTKDDTLLHYKYMKAVNATKATMSDDEIEAMLTMPMRTCQIRRKGKVFIRTPRIKRQKIMTMFWTVFAFTGMRPGEVASLTVDQVDFGRHVFTLEAIDTKTKDPRLVPIAPNIEKRLEEHIAGLTGKYLFPSERGGHVNSARNLPVIKPVDWSYDFQKRIKDLGIKRKNLTPYSLRHSYITTLLEQDVNLFKVQKIVGHRRIETTARYTHMTTKDIVEAVKKHPLVRRESEPELIVKFQRKEDGRIEHSIVEDDGQIQFSLSVQTDGSAMLQVSSKKKVEICI